ncbi:hypothetical protein [Gloeothece citriformis]|uniref:hypothetical protein n=1 Tax=Gloeothece citriformis TaxID=2546356 RepID=UPI003B8372FA
MQNNHKFVSFFKYIHIYEELFFQTILLNLPLYQTILNDDLRYIKWSGKSPTLEILKKDDLEKLKNLQDLFARKFYITVDQNILDIIDNIFLNKG